MADIFEQTPIFQLNLMLWLAWFSPSEETTGIRPIFQEIGFDLYAIEPRFSVSNQKYQRIYTNGIRVKQNPEPDILLKHRNKTVWLPIECKLSSFGSGSNTSEQAYSLLINSGNEIAQHIGVKGNQEWDSLLFYAVKEGEEVAMYQTLQTLSTQLAIFGLTPVDSGSLGIEINDDGVFIIFEPVNDISVAIDSNSPKRIKVKSGDPYFLYIIPIDLEGLNEQNVNDVGVQSLQERLRISLATLTMSQINQRDFSISEDDLMEEAIDVWEIWRKQDAKKGLLNKAVRPYLRKIIKEMRSNDINVEYNQRQIEFSNITASQAKELTTYFSSTAYKRGNIDLIGNLRQLSFDDLEGFWVDE